MTLFSERYKYTNPSDVIIREKITPEIQNAICSCYDRFFWNIENHFIWNNFPYNLAHYIWTNFLNYRDGYFSDMNNQYLDLITDYIESPKNIWYQKLDLLELTIKYIDKYESKYGPFDHITEQFTTDLNNEFKRLHFAYRIVNNEIIEITSEEEIKAIESALKDSTDNIRTHLNSALELYAKRPIGDYRNSIKESISAVEVYCRDRTGEKTLGKALNQLEKAGVIIPQLLNKAFVTLYAYTNQPDTGIRHALMDDTGAYTPGADEALFMLVSCCSFINYLTNKH